MASGGMGMSLGGGILRAFSASAGAESKASMYNFQSGMSLIRAQIARQNAEYSIKVGEDQAYRYGLKAKQEEGKIVARQGAGGLDVNSGSNAEVQKSQKYVTDLDMATIRNNASRRAYGYEVEAATDTAQAGAYSSAARNAKTAGAFDVASSLVSTASSVSDKWLQGREAGLFGNKTTTRQDKESDYAIY